MGAKWLVYQMQSARIPTGLKDMTPHHRYVRIQRSLISARNHPKIVVKDLNQSPKFYRCFTKTTNLI